MIFEETFIFAELYKMEQAKAKYYHAKHTTCKVY